MNYQQGPVFIEEACGCRVDHGIPHWCPAHQIAPRRQHVPECPYCARYTPTEMFPPHDASRRCESGHRDHCTCDVCF